MVADDDVGQTSVALTSTSSGQTDVADLRWFVAVDLPPRFARRAEHAFEALGCNAQHLRRLTHTLVDVVALQHAASPSAIGQTFAMLVAACQSACVLPSTNVAPRSDEEALLSKAEWLVLACREVERHRAVLGTTMSNAFSTVIAHIDEASAGSGDFPPDDYGLGTLVAAIASTSESSLVAVAASAMGKLARLAVETVSVTASATRSTNPYVLRTIAADVGLAARFDVALALACKPLPDKLPLISVLGHPLVCQRIGRLCNSWIAQVSETVAGPGRDVVLEFVTSTADFVTNKTNGVRLWGFAKAPSLTLELDRTIHLVVDALLDDEQLREAWEIQRSGGVFPRKSIGRFFPMSLCTIALDAAGVDVQGRIRALLDMCEVDGFRYFEGLETIAPDSDDLGIALQLVARLRDESTVVDRLVWPVELLVKNTTDEGEIPVWLDRHLRVPLPDDAPTWLGDRCLTVAASATTGLLESGIALPEGFVERVLGWICRTWRELGMKAVFFYGLPYTRMTLARLHEAAAGRVGNVHLVSELRAIVDENEDAIVRTRCTDGSFGTVLDTACSLIALACGSRRAFDPWPAVAFVASRQQYDGLWAAEPLYPTPGKDNVPAAHGSRLITSAICLYAFVRIRDRFARVSE